MRRREFITLLGGAAASPIMALAQQSGRLPVVGFVAVTVPIAAITGSDPTSPPVRAFVHELRDLGWVDGHTFVIERRTAAGQSERLSAIVTELIAHGVDVMVLGGAPWMLQAAQQATRTIPTVTVFPEDPVAAGLVASLARPGGNLTGVTNATGYELIGKRLQILKELAPQTERIAFLGSRHAWDAFRGGLSADQPRLVLAQFDQADQYTEAIETIRRERVDALVVWGGGLTYGHLPQIVKFATESRLPAAYSVREAVDAGGLMSYGPSVPGLWRQLAGYVDRLLKGAKPAELPVEQPTKFELVINLETAKALGLTIPPTLLARADEVIE